jgi:hydrogenase 3 maturation protease
MMQDLEILLKDRLKSAKRIAILGVGSELRGDDIAGILVAQEFNKPSKRFRSFIGGTAPENFTGEIKKFNPTHLVIVDSADMAKSKAGAIRLIDLKDISNFSFCTHRLPLKIMADYLIKCIDCEIIIVGIQPKTLDFGLSCSSEIKKSVKAVSRAIKKAINGD